MKSFKKVTEEEHKILLEKHSDILKNPYFKPFYMIKNEIFWIENLTQNESIMKKLDYNDLISLVLKFNRYLLFTPTNYIYICQTTELSEHGTQYRFETQESLNKTIKNLTMEFENEHLNRNEAIKQIEYLKKKHNIV